MLDDQLSLGLQCIHREESISWLPPTRTLHLQSSLPRQTLGWALHCLVKRLLMIIKQTSPRSLCEAAKLHTNMPQTRLDRPCQHTCSDMSVLSSAGHAPGRKFPKWDETIGRRKLIGFFVNWEKWNEACNERKMQWMKWHEMTWNEWRNEGRKKGRKKEWIHERMNEWMKWGKDWVTEWMTEWRHKGMRAWVNERTNEWIN